MSLSQKSLHEMNFVVAQLKTLSDEAVWCSLNCRASKMRLLFCRVKHPVAKNIQTSQSSCSQQQRESDLSHFFVTLLFSYKKSTKNLLHPFLWHFSSFYLLSSCDSNKNAKKKSRNPILYENLNVVSWSSLPWNKQVNDNDEDDEFVAGNHACMNSYVVMMILMLL